ncbi:MAG: hypothetical protein BWY45_02928 [Euryarchaeota archaeon ADurb.Bin294]|nr:MAG: hypothetical protein BWY45_02928 [Euryarchaeota archaeon ADurb.Bin294]
MDYYETVIEPKQKLIKTTCDICGKDIDWEEEGESYMVRNLSIEYQHGMAWPDDPTYDTFEPDICSKCFRDKIYPKIAELLLPDSLPWRDCWGKKHHERIDLLDR